MPSSISIFVEPDSVDILAGGKGSVGVKLVNRGNDVGQYALSVRGLENPWVQLDTRQVGIFPGDQALVQLRIQPPPEVAAATYRVILAAVNQLAPADQAQATLNLTVQRYGESAPANHLAPNRVPPPVTAQPVAGQAAPQTVVAPRKPEAKRPAFGQAAVKIASPAGDISMTAERKTLAVLAGVLQSFNLELANMGGVGQQIQLILQGPPSGWLFLTPEAAGLAPGETVYPTLTVSVPSQAPIGLYPLAIVAKGDGSLSLRLNLMLQVSNH